MQDTSLYWVQLINMKKYLPEASVIVLRAST